MQIPSAWLNSTTISQWLFENKARCSIGYRRVTHLDSDRQRPQIRIFEYHPTTSETEFPKENHEMKRVWRNPIQKVQKIYGNYKINGRFWFQMREFTKNPDTHLLVIYLEAEPLRVELSGSVVTLGRRPENQIQVLHPAISTCHLSLSPSSFGGYQLTDVGSSNGTMVNGQEVNQCQLRDGDTILIGRAVTAQYQIVRSLHDVAGNLDSLALVRGVQPTFQNLCQRDVAHDDGQVILPS